MKFFSIGFFSRIRSIPFATLRPTFSEIKRVYDQLTKIELYRRMNLISFAFIDFIV